MDFLDSVLFPDNTGADIRRLEKGRGYGMPSAGSNMGIYASQASEDERQAGLSGAASGLGSLVQLLTYMHKSGMMAGQKPQQFGPPTMSPDFQNGRQYQDLRAPFMQQYDPRNPGNRPLTPMMMQILLHHLSQPQ